jgi:hypothetical protein
VRYFGKHIYGAILAVLFGLSAILGFVAISVHQLRFLIEYAGSLGMVGWLMSMIHAGVIYFRSER